MARQKTGAKKKCKICPKEFYVPKCYLDSRKYCSLECAREHSKKLREGENNPNWKGIDGRYAYSNVHKHLARTYGKADHCQNEDCEKRSIVYEWANISGSSERDKKHYVQLCKSCHMSFDRYKKPIKINETYINKSASSFTP